MADLTALLDGYKNELAYALARGQVERREAIEAAIADLERQLGLVVETTVAPRPPERATPPRKRAPNATD